MGLQTCLLNINRAGRELRPQGTHEFPCAGYRSRYTDRAEDAIPWHWHEEIEMVLVETGALKLQIPGKTFRLGPGAGAVINSNIMHAAAAEPSCVLLSLVFHPLLITGNQDSVFARKYLSPLIRCAAFDGRLTEDLDAGIPSAPGCEAAPSVRAEFADAFEALARDAPGCEFTVREKLSHICLALYRDYEANIAAGYVEPSQDHGRIQVMLDYIHSHFSEEIGLPQIAGAAGVGERECLRCFQRTIQIPPVQYLLKYRITQGASMLLQNRAASVSDISGRCGFDSPGNFSQLFRRFFRCTPREYRKENPV